MSKFKTTILTSQSEYLERGSRFIGYLKPIESAADFKNFLKNIRKEHKSSSHVCNAYRFFNNKILEEKGADDGEPSGSAGLPILNELKRYDLVNVGAFVVRYFGGKKLGVPGLVHCYSESIRLCISKTKIISWEPTKTFLITHDYSNVSKIDFLINKHGIKLLNRDFNLYIDSTIEIKEDIVKDFKADIAQERLTNISINSFK